MKAPARRRLPFLGPINVVDSYFFFFQAEDGIRDLIVTGVQTCALPISPEGIGTTQLAAYQWSLDWLADIDRYAGLIINMHRTGLWNNRYNTIAHPTG